MKIIKFWETEVGNKDYKYQKKIKIEVLKKRESFLKMNQILKIIDQIEEKNSKIEKGLKIFLLKNLEKINLKKDFYVFTGSTVGVVPIKGRGIYFGKIDKLGSVRTLIKR